jgi:predicted MPP superfamily phosphohydrolase
MLTFIHLSDIHFSSGDNGSQFDQNQRIRRALLDDLSTRPADGSGFDALLVTGDIAYSGKKEEYESAKGWLDQVYKRTGLSMKRTYVVPGNHDVDRSHVQPTFPLWASHEDIRRAANSVHWCAAIETQLKRDPSHLLLAPFRTYNDFAQGCGCQTTAEDLAWSLDFPLPLELGFMVRLRGLNSALISDAADAPSKLLVSEFQTTKLSADSGVINVVLCHHPPDWLMDKADVRAVLRRFAPVALFGHEHSVRVHSDDKQVQLFAGAFQPPRDEAGWLPTYHIFQLAIQGTEEAPDLLVRVHTREYYNHGFRAGRFEDDQTTLEHRIKVPAHRLPTVPQETALANKAYTMVASTGKMVSGEPKSSDGQLVEAQRDLLVHFFQLRTPQRYEAAFKAGLLRDGDDALEPQAMWAEVFRRAADEAKLGDFWAAIAAHTPVLTGKPNPFPT